MRFITKGEAPAVIAELRRSGETWAAVHGDQKTLMREALRAEQRGLCAYCMRRLRDDMTIEHWDARSESDADDFVWENLLGVCRGIGHRNNRRGTCDARRGNQPLNLHPARRPPDVEEIVRFTRDGRIRLGEGLSKKEQALYRKELLEVLGLGDLLLERNRKAAVDAVLVRIAATKKLSQAKRLKKLREMLARYDGDKLTLPPFPTLVEPLLARAVRQAEASGRRRSRASD